MCSSAPLSPLASPNWPGVAAEVAFAAGAATASPAAIAAAARVELRMPSSPISGQIDACIRIRTYPNARVARIDGGKAGRKKGRRAALRPLFGGGKRGSAGEP